MSNSDLKTSTLKTYHVMGLYKGIPVEFRCQAEDSRHSREQFLDAYPGSRILLNRRAKNSV